MLTDHRRHSIVDDVLHDAGNGSGAEPVARADAICRANAQNVVYWRQETKVSSQCPAIKTREDDAGNVLDSGLSSPYASSNRLKI